MPTDSCDSPKASPSPALQLTGALLLHSGGTPLGGHARIALLEQIEAHGSITAAAKAVGMSYKAAWDAIDAMNNLAGEPLVARSTGGRGGGGTRLTPRGARLVRAFRAVESAQQQFLARLGEDIEQFDTQWRLIGRLGMQTSARNQLYGTVSAIRAGGVNDEVTLSLAGGQSIVATLTHESCVTLGLSVGAEAFALIKASWVMLATEDDAAHLSTRNRLAGTIETVTHGEVDSEVTLALPGGARLASVVTEDSTRRLGLAPGRPVTACFKASSVIVGVLA
ncbi:transcriptional regulator ModE family protein [Pandoraea terrae]|uniref:Transcriptional regulator ModE family protein n=1 Tax=Pandoraea terrae TaxID=1537710 RepID=A0A5E4TDD0_9BURK|nr:TOBE domain-containing protein [Pandoraea terrae]VVD86216.1 transcriptional regulator ModE family protein [Pandoraea terrae]